MPASRWIELSAIEKKLSLKGNTSELTMAVHGEFPKLDLEAMNHLPGTRAGGVGLDRRKRIGAIGAATPPGTVARSQPVIAYFSGAYLGTMIAASPGRAEHGAMLLVHDVDERGEERVVVLPLGSVISFFTSRADAPGVTLHLQPSVCAFPELFAAQSNLVCTAVPVEAPSRLQVGPEEVVLQSFVRLKEVVDPDPAAQPRYFQRKRSKGRNVPFSR